MSTPRIKEIIRNPREYKASSFIDRNSELETISKKVRQAQTEDMIVEPVVHFWGVGGVGKTWLLRHLQHTYDYSAKLTTEPSGLEPRPTFALYYAFPDGATEVSLLNLTKSLVSQVLSQLAPVLSEDDQANFVQAGNSGNIKVLVNALRRLSDRFVPLILLDNTERIDSSDWAELEQVLVEPLVSTNRVLMVVAGRRRGPRWRRFEVRRRAMEPGETRVRPFDKYQVTKQVEQQGYRVPVDLLFSYTAGNPHLIDAIIRHVRDWTNGKQPDPGWFDQHQNDLLLPILQAYEDFLLENVPEYLRQVLHVISPLRAYRLEALRFMLTAQKPKSEAESDGYNLRLLRDLEQQTEVVWWSHGRRAYKTDGVVRRVLNRRLLLQDKAEFLKRHDQAFQMYWKWANDNPEVSEDFIIEVWFHLANIFLADKDQSRLQTETEQALRFAQANLTSDRLIVLHKQLEKGDAELIDLLPDPLHRTLIQLLTPEYI